MFETVDRPRIRGIWADSGPSLLPEELAAAEIREAFGPAWEWRDAAPAERSTTLYVTAIDALPTLTHWGWRTTTALTGGAWVVSASCDVGTRTIKAQVKNESLVDAIVELGKKLTAALTALESQRVAA